MAVKNTIDKLEDVDAALRPHYSPKDGKFVLTFADEHPDTAKVKEMRETNIKLVKERDADRAKLAELEKVKPEARIAELEAALATEKAARTAAQAAADASVLRSVITEQFAKAGGRPSALGFMVAKATDLFTVENGVPVGKVFDPDNPGVKLSVDRFIAMQVRESDFAFLPSSGGGANPRPSSGSGGRAGVKDLVDPTPQQLGEHAAAIKAGTMRVVYSNS